MGVFYVTYRNMQYVYRPHKQQNSNFQVEEEFSVKTSLGTRRLGFSSQSGQVRISNLFWLFMSIVCVDMKFIVQ